MEADALRALAEQVRDRHVLYLSADDGFKLAEAYLSALDRENGHKAHLTDLSDSAVRLREERDALREEVEEAHKILRSDTFVAAGCTGPLSAFAQGLRSHVDKKVEENETLTGRVAELEAGVRKAYDFADAATLETYDTHAVNSLDCAISALVDLGCIGVTVDEEDE